MEKKKKRILFLLIATASLLLMFIILLNLKTTGKVIFWDIYGVSSLSKTYYVDSINGNDLNSGLSPQDAWKTLSKVNSFRFSPGDKILLKRGGVWNETLNVSSSGLPGSEIYYGAYGVGQNPIIISSEPVTNWKVYKDNIYVAENLPFSNIYEVYVDSKHYNLASYPNDDFLDVFGSSNTQILVNATNFDFTREQIEGSIVMAKAWTFMIFVSNAQSYDPQNKKIILSPPLPFYVNLSQGYGFYLKGKLWMLDRPKEWYYDKTEKKLYIWLEGNENPANHEVRASVRDFGVYINNKSNIIIENLTFFDSNHSSVYISYSQNISINQNKIKNGLVGVTILNSNYTRITNNIIEDVLVDGIDANKKVRNIDIINNTINNAGNIGDPRTSYASIFIGEGSTINAENVTIRKNKINNSGYMGIMFFGDYINVEENIIDRSCLVLDDCGGIYTSSFQNVGGNLITRNKINANIVMNSIGNCKGTPLRFYDCYTIAGGIYLDAVSYNNSVINNIIYNADNGIFSNDGHDNIIIGNKIYSSRRDSFGIVSGSFNNSVNIGGLAKNNFISNNLFSHNRTNSIMYFQNSALNHTKDFAIMDNNVYCSKTTRNVILNNVKGTPGEPGYNPNNGLTATYYNLTQWQAYSGQDLNSVWINQSCDFYDLYKINITPNPQKSELLSFELARLNSSWKIYADLSDEYENFTANYLKDKIIKKSFSRVNPSVIDINNLEKSKRIIIGNPNKNDIVRQIADSNKIDINKELTKGFNQGYILIVNPEEILILANSTAGTFYGVVSLIWLLNYDNLTGVFLLPNTRIIDWPDLEYRGFYGDGNINIDGKLINVYNNWTIFLDFLALHKYNLWLSNPGTYYNTSTDDRIILQKRKLADLMHFYQSSPFIPNYISMFSDGYFEGVYAKNVTFKFNSSDFAEPLDEDILLINNSDFELDQDQNGVPDYWFYSPGSIASSNFDNWSIDCTTSFSGRCSMKLNLSLNLDETINSSDYLFSSSRNSVGYGFYYPKKDNVYLVTFWSKLNYPNKNTRNPQLTLVFRNSTGGTIYTKSATTKSEFQIQESGDWKRYLIKVLTTNNETDFYIYSRAQGTRPLVFWLDKIEVISMKNAIINLLETPKTSLRLYNVDRSIEYQKGVDYELISTGRVIPSNPLNANAKKTIIKRLPTGRILPNSIVLADYDYAVCFDTTGDCWITFADDSFFDFYENAVIKPTIEKVNPDFAFVNFDEIRGFNRDSRAIRKNYSNYELYTFFLNEYIEKIKNNSPNVRVITWDDHHVPFHNGQDENYQVPYGGPVGKTWYALDLISRDYENIIWWYDDKNFYNKMTEAPKLYNKYGFRWFAGPFNNEKNIKWWSYITYKYGGKGMIEHVFFDDFTGLPIVANYSWNSFKQNESSCSPENIEICDGIDNDCDNVYWIDNSQKAYWHTNIDEGFNLSSDPFNCGSCGNICYYPRAYSSCVNGVCKFEGCFRGFIDKNNDLRDGCEDGGVEGLKVYDIRYCGDSVCNGAENCVTCPNDCKCENQRKENGGGSSLVVAKYEPIYYENQTSNFSKDSGVEGNKSIIKRIIEVFSIGEEEQPLKIKKHLFYVFIISSFILLLILFFILRSIDKSEKPSLIGQARIRAIELKNKGYTREQIKRKFVELGWDPKVVENYIFWDNF